MLTLSGRAQWPSEGSAGGPAVPVLQSDIFFVNTKYFVYMKKEKANGLVYFWSTIVIKTMPLHGGYFPHCRHSAPVPDTPRQRAG